MEIPKSLRKKGVAGSLLLSAALLAAACAENAPTDTAAPQEEDISFIAAARPATAGDNDLLPVGKLPAELKSQYDQYPKYAPQSSMGDDNNNGLAFTPRRFETSFTEGDGSGADVVCEELKVPEGIRYVQAVTPSEEDAWIGYREEKQIAYLCFPHEGNPATVAVWASSAQR